MDGERTLSASNGAASDPLTAETTLIPGVPVQMTLGITDGTSTEVLRGDPSVGQAVLIGFESESPATPSTILPRIRP